MDGGKGHVVRDDGWSEVTFMVSGAVGRRTQGFGVTLTRITALFCLHTISE